MKTDYKEYVFFEQETMTLVRQRTNNIHRGTDDPTLRTVVKIELE
jgi:hypothetical protein